MKDRIYTKHTAAYRMILESKRTAPTFKPPPITHVKIEFQLLLYMVISATICHVQSFYDKVYHQTLQWAGHSHELLPQSPSPPITTLQK